MLNFEFSGFLGPLEGLIFTPKYYKIVALKDKMYRVS